MPRVSRKATVRERWVTNATTGSTQLHPWYGWAQIKPGGLSLCRWRGEAPDRCDRSERFPLQLVDHAGVGATHGVQGLHHRRQAERPHPSGLCVSFHPAPCDSCWLIPRLLAVVRYAHAGHQDRSARPPGLSCRHADYHPRRERSGGTLFHDADAEWQSAGIAATSWDAATGTLYLRRLPPPRASLPRSDHTERRP